MARETLDSLLALFQAPVGFFLAILLAAGLGRFGIDIRRPGAAISGVIATTLLLLTFGYLAAYLVFPSFTDHVESNIAGNAAYLLHGKALYPPPEHDEWYAIIYGPWLFLGVAASYAVAGMSILASKLPGVAFLCAALLFFFFEVRRERGAPVAALHAALLAAFMFVYVPYVLANRGDGFLLFAVVAALALTRMSHGVLACALIGGLAGLAAGIKFHAPMYLVPAVLLLLSRHHQRWRMMLVFGVTAGVLWWAPYWLSDRISLGGLLAHMALSARHRINADFLALNIQFLLVILATAWLAVRSPASRLVGDAASTKETHLMAGTVILVAAIAIYPASKEGAGAHHVLPLLPYLAWFALRVGATTDDGDKERSLPVVANALAATRWAALALASGGIVAALLAFSRLGDRVDDAYDAQAELLSVIARFGPRYSLSMGFGDHHQYWLTWYRPLLVFRGHPIGIDPVTAMDLQKAGREVPDAYLACRQGGPNPRALVLPARGEPFWMTNYYDLNRRLIERERVERFKAGTSPVFRGRHFAVWPC